MMNKGVRRKTSSASYLSGSKGGHSSPLIGAVQNKGSKVGNIHDHAPPVTEIHLCCGRLVEQHIRVF